MEQTTLGDGVSATFIGSTFGNLSMQGWISLGLLHVLRPEMDLGCCFGMVGGAGNNLLKFKVQFPDLSRMVCTSDAKVHKLLS